MKFRHILALLFALGQLQAQNMISRQQDTFTINAPQLNTQEKVTVYLPKKYESGHGYFPVLYMVNGKKIMGNLANLEESLFNIKARAIVVDIDHDPSFTKLDDMDRFLDFVALNLKPQIDQTYRTETKSGDTGLLGAGDAGLMAFYGSLRYPDIFGRIGCFSPASVTYWQEIVNAMAKTDQFRLTRIYFLHGAGAVEASTYIEHWVNTKRCSCKKFNKRVYAAGQQDNTELWHEGFKKAYLWLL